MAEKTVPATMEDRLPETREEDRFLVPPVDIYETSDGLAVVADLPGVDKEDLSIRVEDNILTIDGKAHDGLPGEAIRSEFALANFHRQFRLSDEVDQERITADLKNGVLQIQLPKAEKAKPKMIAVNVK